MARGGLGAPAGPRLPPPSAGGGPRPSIPRPAHPAREGGDGEAFLEKLKGSPSGHPASRARHQTPTSRRNQRSPTRVSSPLQLGGGRRERGARARGSRGEAGRPASPSAGPTARGPGARHSSCPKPNNLPDRGTGEGAWPGHARPPLPPSRSPSLRVRRGRGAELARSGSGAAPTCAALGPRPGEVRTNLVGQPGQLGRRATAYAETGGGGITCGGRRLHPDAAGRRRRAAPWTLHPRPRPRRPPRSTAEEPRHHGRRQRRRPEQQHMTL